MVKVVITAPRGAMDSLIVQEAFRNEYIEVIGCVGTPGRDYIGKDAGQVCGLHGTEQFNSASHGTDAFGRSV